MKKSFLFLAEGFEEVEALTVVDVLRRGGVEIATVSISGVQEVIGAHGVKIVADQQLEAVVGEAADCLIFPGGMPGAQHLGACRPLLEWLQQHYDRGDYVAAICAAPALVLTHLKTTRKLRLTCYPGFEQYIPQAEVLTDGTVVDGKVITGKGPGFSVPFALTVLEHLRSAEKAREVAAGMLW